VVCCPCLVVLSLCTAHVDLSTHYCSFYTRHVYHCSVLLTVVRLIRQAVSLCCHLMRCLGPYFVVDLPRCILPCLFDPFDSRCCLVTLITLRIRAHWMVYSHSEHLILSVYVYFVCYAPGLILRTFYVCVLRACWFAHRLRCRSSAFAHSRCGVLPFSHSARLRCAVYARCMDESTFGLPTHRVGSLIFFCLSTHAHHTRFFAAYTSRLVCFAWVTIVAHAFAFIVLRTSFYTSSFRCRSLRIFVCLPFARVYTRAVAFACLNAPSLFHLTSLRLRRPHAVCTHGLRIVLPLWFDFAVTHALPRLRLFWFGLAFVAFRFTHALCPRTFTRCLPTDRAHLRLYTVALSGSGRIRCTRVGLRSLYVAGRAR